MRMVADLYKNASFRNIRVCDVESVSDGSVYQAAVRTEYIGAIAVYVIDRHETKAQPAAKLANNAFSGAIAGQTED